MLFPALLEVSPTHPYIEPRNKQLFRRIASRSLAYLIPGVLLSTDLSVAVTSHGYLDRSIQQSLPCTQGLGEVK